MRRKKKKPKIPSRATRRRYSVGPPRSASLLLTHLFQRRFRRFEKEIRKILFPVLSDLSPRDGAVREDALIPVERVRRRLEWLEVRIGDIFNEADIDKDLELVGKRVSRRNKTLLSRVPTIALAEADPGVFAMVEGFRASNIAKIRSLVGQQLREIHEILKEAAADGLRVEVVQKQIQERFGVSRSKAALLARDQTLTLNRQITQQRQINAGIDEYIWTTSGDGRVRERHAELDGTTQRWDTPPEISDDGRTGHPGDDHQCRCTAYPVLQELQ